MFTAAQILPVAPTVLVAGRVIPKLDLALMGSNNSKYFSRQHGAVCTHFGEGEFGHAVRAIYEDGRFCTSMGSYPSTLSACIRMTAQRVGDDVNDGYARDLIYMRDYLDRGANGSLHFLDIQRSDTFSRYKDSSDSYDDMRDDVHRASDADVAWFFVQHKLIDFSLDAMGRGGDNVLGIFNDAKLKSRLVESLADLPTQFPSKALKEGLRILLDGRSGPALKAFVEIGGGFPAFYNVLVGNSEISSSKSFFISGMGDEQPSSAGGYEGIEGVSIDIPSHLFLPFLKAANGDVLFEQGIFTVRRSAIPLFLEICRHISGIELPR